MLQISPLWNTLILPAAICWSRQPESWTHLPSSNTYLPFLAMQYPNYSRPLRPVASTRTVLDKFPCAYSAGGARLTSHQTGISKRSQISQKTTECLSLSGPSDSTATSDYSPLEFTRARGRSWSSSRRNVAVLIAIRPDSSYSTPLQTDTVPLLDPATLIQTTSWPPAYRRKKDGYGNSLAVSSAPSLMHLLVQDLTIHTPI